VPIDSSTDWISLNSLATHLSLAYDSENADQREELTGILNGSVVWGEQRVHHAILNRAFRVLVRRPGDEQDYRLLPFLRVASGAYYREVSINSAMAPVNVPVRGIRGDMTFAYWEASQTLSEEPSGTITPGRVDPGRYEVLQGTDSGNILSSHPTVYPPADGWPEGLRGSSIVVSGSTGFEAIADIPSPWRIAVLHICSSLFETQQESGNFVKTAQRMLEPWIFRGVEA